MLSVTFNPYRLSVVMQYVILLNFVMLNVVMLNVVMLNVVMLNVVAPIVMIISMFVERDLQKHWIILLSFSIQGVHKV
jgi:hypothetical protein